MYQSHYSLALNNPVCTLTPNLNIHVLTTTCCAVNMSIARCLIPKVIRSIVPRGKPGKRPRRELDLTDKPKVRPNCLRCSHVIFLATANRFTDDISVGK